VKCDAHYLPFKDKVFEKSVAVDVIEHVACPELMIREMARVSSREMYIRCPHRFQPSGKQAVHVNFFNYSRFNHILSKLGLHFDCKVNWSLLFKHIPFLVVPSQLEVSVWLPLDDGVENLSKSEIT
jgi:ubiquinone/menaquinone biosynthesis C-methylase UbiE